mmetsp:Transcript_76700/g.192969  ORF Transcript_76700/g.192969 Transcript_76700/m.192969 type:complete len:206 (+) Transcript_76700:568-1185(+)
MLVHVAVRGQLRQRGRVPADRLTLQAEQRFVALEHGVVVLKALNLAHQVRRAVPIALLVYARLDKVPVFGSAASLLCYAYQMRVGLGANLVLKKLLDLRPSCHAQLLQLKDHQAHRVAAIVTCKGNVGVHVAIACVAHEHGQAIVRDDCGAIPMWRVANYNAVHPIRLQVVNEIAWILLGHAIILQPPAVHDAWHLSGWCAVGYQ